jgi:hypothetical protein
MTTYLIIGCVAWLCSMVVILGAQYQDEQFILVKHVLFGSLIGILVGLVWPLVLIMVITATWKDIMAIKIYGKRK